MNWCTVIIVVAALFSLLPFQEGTIFRKKLRCPSRVLKNGRVRIRSRGRVMKYICSNGYQLVGTKFSTCIRGSWDSPVPVCIKEGCDLDVPHSQLIPTYGGASVTVHCDPGYLLEGPQALYCDGTHWNDTHLPVCQEIVVPITEQRSCDFEGEDLCGWTNDVNHDFDWKRHNFATPSGYVGTGPSFDHTLGPGLNGHYMYLETSSPRMENDTARLFSPVFTTLMKPDSCFIFWYHMFGVTTGSLNVYLQTDDIDLLFSKFGDQGDEWHETVLQLPYMNFTFQIIIEGIRGTGYEGDIAVDDVKLTDGDECKQISVTSDDPQDTTPYVDTTISCMHRCDMPMGDPTLCECTPDCFSNHTCCPDYVETCCTNESGLKQEDPSGSQALTPLRTKVEPAAIDQSTVSTSSTVSSSTSQPTTTKPTESPSTSLFRFSNTTLAKNVTHAILLLPNTNESFQNASEFKSLTTPLIANYTIQRFESKPTLAPKIKLANPSTLSPSILSSIQSSKPMDENSVQSSRKSSNFTFTNITSPVISILTTLRSSTLSHKTTTTTTEPTKGVQQVFTKMLTKLALAQVTKSMGVTKSANSMSFVPLETTSVAVPTQYNTSTQSTVIMTQRNPTLTKKKLDSGRNKTIFPSSSGSTIITRINSKTDVIVKASQRPMVKQPANSTVVTHIQFITPPPPVVYRTPARINILKKRTSSPQTSSTTNKPLYFTLNPKLQKKIYKTISKSQNDILHPVWTKQNPPIHSDFQKQPMGQNITSQMNVRKSTLQKQLVPFEKAFPKDPEPNKAHFTFVATSTNYTSVFVFGSLLVLSAVLITVFVVRRKRVNRRLEDDELDIRFIPPDEILDFTLARTNTEAMQEMTL